MNDTLYINDVLYTRYKGSNYFVSQEGNLYNTFSKKITTGSPDKNGYKRVTYKSSKPCKTTSVHRMVMEIYNPTEGMDELEVNHIDQDKTNNRLENLEWITHQENMNRIYGQSRNNLSNAGVKNGRANLTEEQVREIRASNLSQRLIAKKYGIGKTTVGDIKNYRTWTNI